MRRASRAFTSLVATPLLALAALAGAPSSASAQVDLVLNVVDAPDPVPAGGLITYTIDVTNNEALTATGVEFTIDLPAELTYQGFAGAGVSCSGMNIGDTGLGTVTCTLPDIPFLASVPFTVDVGTITSGFVNVNADVASIEADLLPGNNTFNEQTTVVSGANVALDLTAPANAPAGDVVSFDIDLTNAGPDAATDLLVQFPVPTGFSPTGGLPAGCSVGGGIITCDVAGPIASGGGLSVGSVPGQITSASGSDVTGSASVGLSPTAPPGAARDPDTSDNNDVATIAVTAGSDMRISKSRSVGGPYFVGESFDFILTSFFTGDPPNTITLTDVIPANYTIGAVAPSQGDWTCGVVGQTVTCTQPFGGVAGEDMPLGTVTIPVTVASAGVAVTNTAMIGALLPFDPDPGNNTATDGGVDLLNPSADLALVKGGPDPALVVVGYPFDYTLRVNNGGPSEFYGTLEIQDQIPVGLTVNSYDANGWSCDLGTPIVGPATLTCTYTYTSGSPLGHGFNSPTITLTTVATQVGLLSNTAVLNTTNPNVPDPAAGNNSTQRDVTASQPVDAADIRVLKSVDLDPVPAGEVLTYTIEIVNDGPVAADDVTLTDNLGTLINNSVGPTGAGYLDETATLGVVAPGDMTCGSVSTGTTSRRLTCDIVTLPPCVAGGTCPTVDVRIRPGGDGGPRGNTASAISASTADTILANNAVTISSTVEPRADITVTKTANPDPATAGQELIYVVTARNNGPSRASGVQITDLLPLDVLFVSATPSAGSCTVTPGAGVVTTALNRTLQCGLNDINNGAQRTVTIRVKPTNATRGNNIINDVSVTTTTVEPDPPGNTNNDASETVAVQDPDLDLVVNKSDDDDPLAVGDMTTYRIQVQNIGPSDAENVVITDDLPASGVSFQAYTISTGACTTVPAVDDVGGQLICSVARMAAGETVNITVDVEGVLKGVHTNTVSVESDETVLGFEDGANNTADENTTVRTKADLEIVSKTPSAATVGVRRPFTWTILVRNNVGAGLAEADDVEVTDNLPAGVDLTGTPSVNVTVGSASSTSCTGNAGDTSFTCDLGTVSGGAEVEITVPVRALTVPGGGDYTNTASVTTFSLDVNPANNSNSGDVTVEGSTLSGTVFRDFANDGGIESTDTGIAGIVMTLTGTAFDGSPVSATATTDADGEFTFDDLPEGDYTIERGAVAEPHLTTGQQIVGDRGGDAGTVGEISSIALGEIDTGTGYLFAFIPRPRIGAAKRTVGDPVLLLPDSSFLQEIRVVVENFSLEAIDGVTIEDAMAGAPPRLGTFIPGGLGAVLTLGSYTIETAPAFVGACVGGTPNPAYDGDGEQTLATIASLATGATCDLSFTIRFLPLVPLPPSGYLNSATVDGTGSLSGDTPSDSSDDGSDPDPNGDGDPTPENDPTPISPILLTDVTTELMDFPAAVDAGELVHGTIVFRNDGPYQAEDVTYSLVLAPDLSSVQFLNLPMGATATYDPVTGIVTFTGMPTTLHAGQVASRNGTTGITLRYAQPGTGTSDITSGIGTSTNQGANVLPDAAAITVPGGLIADVTTSLSFPTFAAPGDPVNGTVTFKNNGPSIASDVTYSLTLTPGLAGVTFTNLPVGATATYEAGTGVVTFTGMPATLAPSELVSGDGLDPIGLSYLQHTSATSTVESGIGTSTDQGRNRWPDSASATVVGTITIGIAKAATVLGDTVTYDLRIENTGSGLADSVSVVDDLDVVFGVGNFEVVEPPILLEAPVTGSITLNAGYTGTAGNTELVDQSNPDANTLPPNEYAIIRLVVRITEVTDQGYGVGVYNNSAVLTVRGPGNSGTFTDESVDGFDVDPNGNGDPTDDTGPTPITIPADATIGIAKQASVTGRRVTFDLALENLGNALATAVSVQDDLDVVFGAGNYAIATAPFFVEDPGTLTLNPAFTGTGAGTEVLDPAMAATNTLAMDATATIRFEVDIITVVDLGNGLGVYENQAFTSSMGPDGTTGPYTDSSEDGLDPDPDQDDDPGNNSAPTPFVLPMADLSLVKVGPETALVGDTITYTLTVTNDGPGIALDVQISDSLPAGVAFLSASDDGTETGGVVTWPLVPEVPVGADVIRTLQVEVTAAGSWENVGRVTSSLDPDPTNNDGTDPENRTIVTTALAQADLEVTKSGPSAAEVGDTLMYVITTTNLGPDAARNVNVTDSLPAQAQFIEGSRGATAVGRRVEWPAIPVVEADETVVDTVFVVAPEAGIYENVALATSDTDDPNPSNNDGSNEEATVNTSVGRIDLAIEKSLASELETGEPATWEIVVRNVGTLPTTGVTTITDTLPNGLVFVNADGIGWACDAVGQVVTCTYDEIIDPGSVWTLTLTTDVTAAAGEFIINTVHVETEGEDPNEENNTDSTDPAEVTGDADLVLEKTVSDEAAEVGDVVRYQLALRNVGLGTARDVGITDRLPRGFFLVPGSVTVDGQTVTDPAGTPGPELSFSLGDVPVGPTVRVAYTVRIGVGADLGLRVNSAQAMDATGEASSNVASAAVEIRLGVFTDLGHILGRVFVEVPDSIEFDSEEQEDRYEPTLGVAGVRVYLQDGTSAVTDAFGRFSFTDLRPRTWLVRVDERTLPPGMVLDRLTAKHMGQGSSKMVDLTRGEMARADFGDLEADTLLYQRVEARADLGPVPEIAVPSQLARMGAGSMTRGATGWRAQGGLNGRVSNLGARPGVSPWRFGASQSGGVSLLDRGSMAPLFRRPGSTSGMALDPAADVFGGSGYVTGLRPYQSIERRGEVRYDASAWGEEAATPSSDGLWMLISGFIEGRFDQRSLADGELLQGGVRDRFQDALLELSSSEDDGKRTLGGRAAAFATGELGDGFQATFRFDTEHDPTRRFFNDIRPDEMYDVFGDASSTLFEAQSKGRFFGAVSRGGSYLMYGDYHTATYDAAQLLGRYSRTLNGVMHQYDSEHVALRTFASRDSYSQIVDEIPAMGISGPYALSRADGLLNSERVEILTRDRSQPGVILDIEPMQRFTDYTVEPFTGRIIFKRPIPSIDENLNPVSIRVTYESETNGDEFWVFGADGRVAAGDHLSLGAGFVRDDAPGNRYELMSANAGLSLGDGTWMSGEFAQSDSAGVQDGKAWRVELRHASSRLDFRGFYMVADSTFQNSSAGVGVGRTEMGATGGILLGGSTSFLGEAIRSVDDRTDGTLTGGRVALLQRIGEHVTAQVGYRFATQEGTVTGPSSSVEDVSAVGGRLEVGSAESLTLFGEYEQDVNDSDARRLAVGGDVRVLDRMRLYARHELLSSLQGPYTLNQGLDRNSTVFGVSADYREGQSVFSEYRAGNGISGRGAHAAIGLRNQWEVTDGVRLHTTLERVSPVDTASTGDVLALTGALELTTSPNWKGTLRAEYRATDSRDHVLGSIGLASRLSDELTLLAQSIGSKVLDGGPLYERTRVGLAYRSDGRKGLNGLARYEHRTDEGVWGEGEVRDHRAHIFSTHLNLRPVQALTLRGQWAAKYATDQIGGQTVEQSAQLVAGRGTIDIAKRLDIGGIARAHMGEGRTQYGLGIELGLTLGGGMRLGAGYNWFGFKDDDLSLDEYTDKGFFVGLGLSFDESLFGFGENGRRRVGAPSRR